MACPNTVLSGCAFAQFLVSQEPVYDKLILEDITPVDSWIGNMSTGIFPAASGVEHTQDRFRDVFPNTLKPWRKTQASNCIGQPCDKPRATLGWGADRKTYGLEEQNWKSDLLCFDQMMHITHAREHFSQIISDVLRPATSAIQSVYMRKRALTNAKLLWQANQYGGSGLPASQFTFDFALDANGDETLFNCSVSPNTAKNSTDVGLLTPQMLQRRFEPQMKQGYAGKNPFKDTAPFIELVTDIQTCWSLDRLGGSVGIGGGNNPNVASNWRFTEWGAAEKYWRYGYSGQLGNFLVRTDWAGLRMNFIRDLGAAAAPNRYQYQILQPYVNKVTTGAGGAAGLGREVNPDFDNAQYRISFIWHKKAMEFLVADATPINSQMPFSARDFGGKWQFVMHDLGADADGKPIENFLMNKGMFVADFKQAIRPLWTEFAEGIFHKAEPQCVYVIQPCSADPGYPAQNYNSANTTCTAMSFNLTFTPILAVHADGTPSTYEIFANTITCDGEPIGHAAITGTTTVAALATQLALLLPASFGTWSVSGANIVLTATPCSNIEMNFRENIGQ